MVKTLLSVFLSLAVFCTAISAFAEKGKDKTGEEKFKAFCAVCHPDGMNVINPKKTLHKADREANGVKTVDDIMGRMRNPGPGMTKFDEKTVSNKDARAIAEYVLKTFN